MKDSPSLHQPNRMKHVNAVWVAKQPSRNKY